MYTTDRVVPAVVCTTLEPSRQSSAHNQQSEMFTEKSKCLHLTK